MSFRSAPPSVSLRRRHHLVAFSFFLVLGFHVGVWAVQLAPLAAALGLEPGRLGLVLTAAAAAGVVTLFAGGRLADRFGRRAVLLIGFTGTAVAFVWLGQAGTVTALVPAALTYGFFVSFVDLGANTVGADHEHTHGVEVMTGLHAGFSLGALLGALGCAVLLWAGVDHGTVYQLLAAVLAATAVLAAVAPLPAPAPAEPPAGPGSAPSPGGRDTRAIGVWRIPAVMFAVTVAALTFFGDGALESFLAVYLRQTLASGVLLSGVAIGSYHLASFAGRVVATRLLRRWGIRRLVTGAGLLASAGIALAVSTAHVGAAIAGLLLVGFAVAPIVPSALSLAGRSAPGRSGQAVAITTAAGYSAFIVSPVLVGSLADISGLRLALSLLVLTTLAVTVLGLRWPRT